MVEPQQRVRENWYRCVKRQQETESINNGTTTSLCLPRITQQHCRTTSTTTTPTTNRLQLVGERAERGDDRQQSLGPARRRHHVEEVRQEARLADELRSSNVTIDYSS
jgi:hypothetical protein